MYPDFTAKENRNFLIIGSLSIPGLSSPCSKFNYCPALRFEIFRVPTVQKRDENTVEFLILRATMCVNCIYKNDKLISVSGAR